MKMCDISASETRDVYLVWGNTDNTEGRGMNYPMFVCHAEATAIRLSKEAYVQGSDSPVTKSKAFRLNHNWYVPGRIIQPTKEDDKMEQVLREEEARRMKRESVLQKLADAGISDEDIKILKDEF